MPLPYLYMPIAVVLLPEQRAPGHIPARSFIGIISNHLYSRKALLLSLSSRIEKLQILRHNAIVSMQKPLIHSMISKEREKTRHGMIGLCAFHQPRHLRVVGGSGSCIRFTASSAACMHAPRFFFFARSQTVYYLLAAIPVDLFVLAQRERCGFRGWR